MLISVIGSMVFKDIIIMIKLIFIGDCIGNVCLLKYM